MIKPCDKPNVFELGNVITTVPLQYSCKHYHACLMEHARLIKCSHLLVTVTHTGVPGYPTGMAIGYPGPVF